MKPSGLHCLACGRADPREWNMDMSQAPTDGTIIEAVARYPTATAGYPRYIGMFEGQWCEFSKHHPEPVVPWAWRPRTDWPREPA